MDAAVPACLGFNKSLTEISALRFGSEIEETELYFMSEINPGSSSAS